MAVLPEYETYDALGLAELVRKREVSAAKLLEAAFARVDALNPKLCRYIGMPRACPSAYSSPAGSARMRRC